jgi:1-acyl-sn-glycerol-3-phosphate acyltransferase
MLAIQSKMPVVPIALIGTDKIAGRSFSESIRPRRVTVVVGTPVETTNMNVEDRNKLACSIYTGMFPLFMYCLCRIRDGF